MRGTIEAVLRDAGNLTTIELFVEVVAINGRAWPVLALGMALRFKDV